MRQQGGPGRAQAGLTVSSWSDSLWQKGETSTQSLSAQNGKECVLSQQTSTQRPLHFWQQCSKPHMSLSSSSARGRAQHRNVRKVITAAPKLHKALIKPPPEKQDGLYQRPWFAPKALFLPWFSSSPYSNLLFSSHTGPKLGVLLLLQACLW